MGKRFKARHARPLGGTAAYRRKLLRKSRTELVKQILRQEKGIVRLQQTMTRAGRLVDHIQAEQLLRGEKQ